MAKVKEQCRLCRREGDKLFLKGERCKTQKCSFFRRSYAPGEHGLSSGRRKVSDYGNQLREKQKVKRTYGILEAQFRTYYKKAERKKGLTGETLLILLEMRFDNVVYKMGFASSRKLGRQLVNHGHFEINGKKVSIPSYNVKKGDKITVKKSSQKNEYFASLKSPKDKEEVVWLSSDVSKFKGEVIGEPKREDIDSRINEKLIVELYSK